MKISVSPFCMAAALLIITQNKQFEQVFTIAIRNFFFGMSDVSLLRRFTLQTFPTKTFHYLFSLTETLHYLFFPCTETSLPFLMQVVYCVRPYSFFYSNNIDSL